jgi:beta-N-acetylhexosaminidase
MNRYYPSFCIRSIYILLISILAAFSQDDLDHKIAQMIMVSFSPGSDFEDTLYYDIEHRNLGGVIFFAYNLQNPEQIANLTTDLQYFAETPLLIATDQEGGRVARLDEQNGFQETHTAFHLGTEIDKEDSTRAQASMMAGWMYDSGINLNLAPVVDVNVNPSSPAIGYYGRSFSSDPIKVYDHASWFISEFQKKNVISTLKHFPGHGSAVDDSHLGFTDVTNTWTESELIPYRELILDGYSDVIMSAHIFNANIDSVYPASLSKITISELLRDSLDFDGVVCSDAMFMRAITDNYSFEEALELAINAGTDLLLYTKNDYNGSSLVAEVIRIVKEKINDGFISRDRIEESYTRIMELKDRLTHLAVSDVKTIPESFSISVYPNPFNITTTIQIDMGKSGPVEIMIYNVLGQQVFYKQFQRIASGKHLIRFEANNLASGVYILRVNVSGIPQVKKVTLMK